MREMKAGRKTSEFWVIVALAALFSGCLYFVKDGSMWAADVTILCSAYIFGRGLSKKSRVQLVEKAGIKSTEFQVLVVGSILLAIGAYSRRVSLDVTLLCLSVVGALYVLGRSHAKSFSPTSTKVNLIR